MKTLISGLALSLAALPALAAPKPDLVTIVRMQEQCAAVSASDTKESALLATVTAMIIGDLVKAGIKGLGEALTKAGAPSDIHVEGSQASYFYKATLGDKPNISNYKPCILFASGVPGGEGADVASTDVVLPAAGKVWLPSVAFSKTPSLYMEVRIMQSNDLTAFRLVPVGGYVGAPFVKGGKDEKPRDLVITLSVLKPAATAAGDAMSTRSFTLKKVIGGRTLTRGELADFAADWAPLPALNEAAKTRLDAALQRQKDLNDLDTALTAETVPAKRTDLTKRKAKIAELLVEDTAYLKAVTPVTFRIDVHETANGDKVVAAIGKFLTGNADKLAEGVVNEVEPTARAKVEAAAANQEQALRITAIEAVEAWRTTEDSTTASAGQKRVKKLQAQGACRALSNAGFDDVTCAELAI